MTEHSPLPWQWRVLDDGIGGRTVIVDSANGFVADTCDGATAALIVERVNGWNVLRVDRDELREEIDRFRRTITLVWQALLRHGVVADNKTSISEFVDRLGAERDELRAKLHEERDAHASLHDQYEDLVRERDELKALIADWKREEQEWKDDEKRLLAERDELRALAQSFLNGQD